ncbi:hypothetical protein K458DRAFT_184892 [Lentithecium fluviatile CBS 122367]|uniref:Uncharacterized protein n=1 Tax=Lentithecium fluviatile CBS 122367 TaxID=1168545 RepID=A0A6G1J8Z9_9PLEO|nr:hypothetical protein K458DRAFT_184892 [Lentithecium fluviatile CBS 122367]
MEPFPRKVKVPKSLCTQVRITECLDIRRTQLFLLDSFTTSHVGAEYRADFPVRTSSAVRRTPVLRHRPMSCAHDDNLLARLFWRDASLVFPCQRFSQMRWAERWRE